MFMVSSVFLLDVFLEEISCYFSYNVVPRFKSPASLLDSLTDEDEINW